MYDWPEERAQVDRRWAVLRDRMRSAGIAAPDALVRRNADMPAVPGGIRAADGTILAPDPASLPPDGFDLAVLWRHPALLFAETCWGPLAHGLAPHVTVVGQSDYGPFEGGAGPDYCSAIVARRADGLAAAPSADGRAVLPLELFRGRVLAFNEPHSMSGYMGLRRDLTAEGPGMDLFGGHRATGAHRASIRAVAEGQADFAAIDCRSWFLARQHEPAAQDLHVVGWTARSPGIPYIRAAALDPATAARLGHVMAQH
ncbi:PhnD/SsuA/transferrin family substrate-binding protein [Gluconacetobacter tumulisoli]|uniref:PhnD/SsuA/transferrin family substrate-binding protein n=2 Tax=Gluconacetobacter tumulisoli TaxID=1286189 RepID=A0A7W4KA82_9PROT|nr:PhnD/SsuA/transferrin family substrate-binding protein [Gluconacetobacter tumulisoli]